MIASVSADEHTHGSEGVCAEIRIELAERLRARHVEIEQAILERVSNRWFKRQQTEDPEYAAGLRAAAVAALDHALTGLERWGAMLAPAPAPAIEQARRAARMGVGLETVLRRYFAGHAVLADFVMQEAEDGVLGGREGALREVLRIISVLTDRLVVAVGDAYEKESEPSSGVAMKRGDDSHEAPEEGAGDAGAQNAAPGSPRTDLGRGAPAERGEREPRALARLTGAQHERIVRALVEVAAEHGFANTSVKAVTVRAGVSSRTFYEQFDGLQECFVAVLDLALQRAGGTIAQAFAEEDGWRDGLLRALASLLVFFDSEPLLTRVWFVEAMAAGLWALQRRELIVAQLRALIVEQWPELEDERLDQRTIAGVMASVMGLIQAHLVAREPEPLIELLGPLMRLITTHYLDALEVEREVRRARALVQAIRLGRAPTWASSIAHTPMPGVARSFEVLPAPLANPSARRARECVRYLAEHPGSSNAQVATGIGVMQKSQISTLLTGLFRDGLVDRRTEGLGKPNSWRLTARGEEAARALVER